MFVCLQVGALHTHVAALEEELGSRSSEGATVSASAREAEARAADAEARAAAAAAAAENLARQVALLQERVGRGEYNAATTRVLHFKASSRGACRPGDSAGGVCAGRESGGKLAFAMLSWA